MSVSQSHHHETEMTIYTLEQKNTDNSVY